MDHLVPDGSSVLISSWRTVLAAGVGPDKEASPIKCDADGCVILSDDDVARIAHAVIRQQNRIDQLRREGILEYPGGKASAE
jgi:hypothetical protein